MTERNAAALTEATRRRATELYAEYARGNRDLVFGAMDEAVAWTSVAAASLPWTGLFQGRAGVEDYFGRVGTHLAITAYEVEQLVCDGEWAAARVRATGRFHATGEEVTLAKADFMRLRDGRILEFREYYDGLALAGCLDRCQGGSPG